MAYKNTLKDYLKFEKLKEDKNKTDKFFNQEREYQLSFKSDNYTNNPHHMTIDNIIEYVQTNYIEKDSTKQDIVEKGYLINDLVVFKTCRENIELEINDQGFVINIIAIEIAIFAVMASIVCKDIDSSETTFPMFLLAICIPMLDYLYLKFRWCKSSQYNKLKTINDVVYTLEAIKDNLAEVSETSSYYIGVSNLIDGKSEPRNYFVSVNEILEDKINEGKIEDKENSIEIKINL